MKKFFTKPKLVGAMVGVGSTLCTSVTAFAAGETTAPTIDWASAGTTISSQFSNATTVLIPVGIVIFSTLLAIGFGPKIIKKLAK